MNVFAAGICQMSVMLIHWKAAKISLCQTFGYVHVLLYTCYLKCRCWLSILVNLC